jgi:hypothetical protein
MLQALLNGKLSSQQENMEDLLTSSVFGLLEYLPPESGLLPLLCLASYADGSGIPVLRAPGIRLERIEFWPTYEADKVAPTEPDVLIRLRDCQGKLHLVLVEVKLWSGKSSHPDPDSPAIVDQLAREWRILLARCHLESATPHMLYVTSATRYPVTDISTRAGCHCRCVRVETQGRLDGLIQWRILGQFAEELDSLSSVSVLSARAIAQDRRLCRCGSGRVPIRREGYRAARHRGRYGLRVAGGAAGRQRALQHLDMAPALAATQG